MQRCYFIAARFIQLNRFIQELDKRINEFEDDRRRLDKDDDDDDDHWIDVLFGMVD